jgi:hypothetical protein
MSGLVAAAFTPRATSAFEGQTPQPLPSPNAPGNQNVPVGLNGGGIPVNNGEKTIPPATWLDIQSDSKKLLEMATDFNTQINKTNLSMTLSLPLLQEAHRIEKLAKQIQDKMKR